MFNVPLLDAAAGRDRRRLDGRAHRAGSQGGGGLRGGTAVARVGAAAVAAAAGEDGGAGDGVAVEVGVDLLRTKDVRGLLPPGY